MGLLIEYNVRALQHSSTGFALTMMISMDKKDV